MGVPLAEKIRPKTLDDIVGQKELLSENKPLRRIIESGKIPNMIFYGPSGVGKTTVARLIAENANMTMHKLNGTNASVADIKQIVAETQTLSGINGILLYLDEIQYLNKKQQQSLLEYIEDGSITLISSTTENPYFYVYNAIISRSTVFEFKPVTADEIKPAITRAFQLMANELGLKLRLENGVVDHIAHGCGGDVRKSINTVELCILSADNDGERLSVSLDSVRLLTQRSNMRYDRDGDSHYDILSALQKSIRGSDENAALHYAARLIEAGDIISLSRRLLVIASEDIGLANPNALLLANAAFDAVMKIGWPEGRIPLAEATVYLATSPKSNSAYLGIDAALSLVRRTGNQPVPLPIRNAPTELMKELGYHDGYQYPHDFPGHFTPQQYMPDALVNERLWHGQHSPIEEKMYERMVNYWGERYEK